MKDAISVLIVLLIVAAYSCSTDQGPTFVVKHGVLENGTMGDLIKKIRNDEDTLHILFGNVLAFTFWNDKQYYYVCDRTFNRTDLEGVTIGIDSAKMGLIGERKKLVLPMVYDMIYKPDATVADAVVIEKDRLQGLYRPEPYLLIEPAYDRIYPAIHADGIALVEHDGKLGKMLFNGEVVFNDTVWNTMSTTEPFGVNIDHNSLLQLLHTWPDLLHRYTDQVVYSLRNHYLFTQYYHESFDTSINNELDTLNTDLDNFFVEVSFHQPQVEDMIWPSDIFQIVSMHSSRSLFTRDRYFKQVDETKLKRVLFSLATTTDTMICKVWSAEDAGYADQGHLLQITRPEFYRYSKYYEMPVHRFVSVDSKGVAELLDAPRYWDFTKYVRIDTTYLEGNLVQVEPTPAGGIFMFKGYYDIEDLELMIQEIYAEHGYIFDDLKFHHYFNTKDWYKPLYTNVDDKLSDIERHNIEVIKRKIAVIKADSEKYSEYVSKSWQ